MEIAFTEHPILERPTDKEILYLAEHDRNQLSKLYFLHENRIRKSIEDPIRHGFELKGWGRIRDALANSNECLCLGGHRSGKTTGCSKIVMESVINENDGHVVCFSQNADTSIKVQQAAVWGMMPKEFRKKTRSMEGYINWSMQNGFTGNSFIFPDTRTRVDFKTYTQFNMNNTVLEGYEFGFMNSEKLNIGAWLDEYYGDETLVNTLRFRLATRNSKLVIGFTPIDGYTPFIADYLRDAETLETQEAELLNNERLPIRQYSPDRGAVVCYLHSVENPFGGYDRIKKDLAGRPREEILVRAYGVPVKSITALLPLFSTEVNVLSEVPNKYGMTFPDISESKRFTWYQVVDPAGNRNYCSIWAAVDKAGQIYIRKEWPDKNTYGEWAIFGEPRLRSLFGEPRWRFGPAANKIGLNVQGYVDLFTEIEDELGIEVFERIGDSRFFAKENEDNEDLFIVFDDLGMYFVPSHGGLEQAGVTALDEWFFYNTELKIDKANRPKCFIHSDCGNLIDSLINYNMAGKSDRCLKDFFDLIRYLRMANAGEGPMHVDAYQMTTTLSTKGGY